MIAVGLLTTQLVLGVVSVLTVLAIPPVSMHTLFAAALLSILVALATIGAQSNAEVETPDMSTTTL
jgi:heme A synthase